LKAGRNVLGHGGLSDKFNYKEENFVENLSVLMNKRRAAVN